MGGGVPAAASGVDDVRRGTADGDALPCLQWSVLHSVLLRVIGADGLGPPYILPYRLWTGANGSKHRGVLVVPHARRHVISPVLTTGVGADALHGAALQYAYDVSGPGAAYLLHHLGLQAGTVQLGSRSLARAWAAIAREARASGEWEPSELWG